MGKTEAQYTQSLSVREGEKEIGDGGSPLDVFTFISLPTERSLQLRPNIVKPS